MLSEPFVLLLRTLVIWLFLFAPGFCLAIVMLRRNCRDPILLGLGALAAMGGWGYLCFYICLWSPLLLKVVEFLPVPVLLWMLLAWRPLLLEHRALLGQLFRSASLAGLLALSVLSIGFLYSGLSQPFVTAATRFSDPLPPDQEIPYLFGNSLGHGQIPKPFPGYWLSSDRPPLQTGLYLAQLLVARGRVGYIVLGVAAQSLWVFGLLYLLSVLSISRTALRLSILACLSSGTVLLNTFYVWPKMLSAAYMAGFLALMLSSRYRRLVGTRFSVAALAGTLLALSLLAHGGHLFTALGIFSALLILRKLPRPRAFLQVVMVAILVYLPWSAYQRFLDPPGNRLIKLHFAGEFDPNQRTLVESLRLAYGQLTFQQWLADRIGNATVTFGFRRFDVAMQEFWSAGKDLVTAWGTPKSAAAAKLMQVNQFFFLAPSLDVLALGFLAALVLPFRGKKANEGRTAMLLSLVVFLSLLWWWVLMFRGGSAILHQGSYLTLLLTVVASVLFAFAVSPGFAGLVAALHLLLNFAIYSRVREAVPLSLQTGPSLRPGLLVLAIAAALSLAWTLFKVAPIATAALGESSFGLAAAAVRRKGSYAIGR